MPRRLARQERTQREQASRTHTADAHTSAPPAEGPQALRRVLEAPGRLARPGDVLALQRTIGNRAVGRLLHGGALQRDVKFARFQGYGGLRNWGWYSTQEERIRASVARAGGFVRDMAPWTGDPHYGAQVKALSAQFTGLDGKTYAQAEYDALEKSLAEVHDAPDTLSSRIARRDTRRDADLDTMLGAAFTVVEPKAKRTKSNQLTAAELADLRSLLAGVVRDERSNLRILAERGAPTPDLAMRASSLGLSAPPELLPLEVNYAKLEKRREALLDERATLKQENKQKPSDELAAKLKKVGEELEAVDAQQTAISDAHWILVQQMLEREVLRDLVRIAQTGVGRELLTAVARQSLQSNANKVTIHAFAQYRAPTASESKDTGKPYVQYTPQYFRDRDTEQRQQGGAIHTAERLARHNPWQENARTDITLFHELVHTHHMQQGTSKTDNRLVSADDVADAVDRPNVEGTRGVREEEYFTVGLGEFAGLRLTENTYRAETSALGQLAAPREHYTHKNERGDPIGL